MFEFLLPAFWMSAIKNMFELWVPEIWVLVSFIKYMLDCRVPAFRVSFKDMFECWVHELLESLIKYMFESWVPEVLVFHCLFFFLIFHQRHV
jgi:hypothetical protein